MLKVFKIEHGGITPTSLTYEGFVKLIRPRFNLLLQHILWEISRSSAKCSTILLTTFVCLTFGAEQQGYSGHIELLVLFFPPESRMMRSVRLNQNREVLDKVNQNNKLKGAKMLHRAEFSVGSSLQAT